MHMSSGLPLGRRRPRIRPLLLAGSGPAATGCPMPLVAGLAISGADTRLRHSPLARSIDVRTIDQGDAMAERTVLVEREGPVTVVTINRPERRNAVDGPTAAALAGAFRAFDADPDSSVAVLAGAGGAFCAGADLKAIAAGAPPRMAPGGDGPMGPTRLRLSKPVLAAIEGPAVRRWPAQAAPPPAPAARPGLSARNPGAHLPEFGYGRVESGTSTTRSN